MMYSPKELCIFRQRKNVLPTKRTMYSLPKERVYSLPKERRTFRQSNDVLPAKGTMYSCPNNAAHPSTILIKAWTVGTKPSALILCLGVVRFISAVRFIESVGAAASEWSRSLVFFTRRGCKLFTLTDTKARRNDTEK